MYNQRHTNKTFFENHFLLELAVERREQNDKILDNAIHLIFFLIKNFLKTLWDLSVVFQNNRWLLQGQKPFFHQ